MGEYAKIGRPLQVVVTMDSGATGWEKLCPDASFEVDGCQFILNPDETVAADFWIVFANARSVDCMECAPENTLLIVGEPEEKKVYPRKYYQQFYNLIDTHFSSGHSRCQLHAPCFAWHVGLDHQTHVFRYGYDELKKAACPTEIKNQISVVCSDAAHTPGQRKRLDFLSQLKASLGSQLVHFGRGFEPIDDKMDAIRGYRLNLVLENCQAPHYWTEKLSDAYLGWAYPFYAGCPNLADYFDMNAFTALDLDDPEEAAKMIQAMLDSPISNRERNAVATAREQILDAYNPWVRWAKWAQTYYQAGASVKPLIIRSHKAFRSFPKNLIFRMRSLSK